MANTYNFNSDGGEISLGYQIKDGCEVSFTSDASWLTVSNSNGTISIKASKNNGDDRNGTITPSVNGTPCNGKKIYITQDKGEVPCEISRTYTTSGNVGTIYLDACETSRTFQVSVSSITEYVNDCKPKEVNEENVDVTVTTTKNCGDSERVVKTLNNVYAVRQYGNCQDSDCQCETRQVTEEGTETTDVINLDIEVNKTSIGCEGGEITATPYYTWKKTRVDTIKTINCHDEVINTDTITVEVDSGRTALDNLEPHTFETYNCMQIEEGINNTHTFTATYEGKTAEKTVTQTCNKCGECGCDSIGSITPINVSYSGGSNIEIASFSNALRFCEEGDTITFETTTPQENEFIHEISLNNNSNGIIARITPNDGLESREENVIVSINNTECQRFSIIQTARPAVECTCEAINWSFIDDPFSSVGGTSITLATFSFKDGYDYCNSNKLTFEVTGDTTFITNVRVSNNTIIADISANDGEEDRSNTVIFKYDGNQCGNGVTYQQKKAECTCESADFSLSTNPVNVSYIEENRKVNFTKNCGTVNLLSKPTWVTSVDINNDENYLTFRTTKNITGGERSGVITLFVNNDTTCQYNLNLTQSSYDCDEYAIRATPSYLLPSGGTVQFVCLDQGGAEDAQELTESEGHWSITPNTFVQEGNKFGEFIFSENTSDVPIRYEVEFVHDFGCNIKPYNIALPLEGAIEIEYYYDEGAHDVYDGYNATTGFNVLGLTVNGQTVTNYSWQMEVEVDYMGRRENGDCYVNNTQNYTWTQNSSINLYVEAGLGQCRGATLSIKSLILNYNGISSRFNLSGIDVNTTKTFTLLIE